MDARDDPEYLRLYREYSSSMRDLGVAVDSMIQVWNEVELARKREVPDGVRRPVGAGPGWRRPPKRKPKPRPPCRPKPIYMGRILGYVTFQVAPTLEEPPPIDYKQIRVEVAEKRCWDAVDRYEEAKRAFFDYTRRQQMDFHERRAKEEFGYATNLQWLGADDEQAIKAARQHVDRMCTAAWRIYKSAPQSMKAKKLLVGNLAKAQMVGLESPVAQAMTQEMERLINAGALRRTRAAP